MSYAELLTASAFSFLEGASHPQALVEQAAALGHAAIGIADQNTVAGVVRAHAAAKAAGLRLVVGSRLVLADAPDMACYPTDRAAWGRLCRLLTLGKGARAEGRMPAPFRGCSGPCRRADFYRRAACRCWMRNLPPGCARQRQNCPASSTWQRYARYAPDDAERLLAFAKSRADGQDKTRCRQ